MSLLKAAVAGFSAAGANVANKYLDDQIQRERAQFMAELQRTTAGQIRADLAFKTDPNNLKAVGEAEKTATLSRAEAQREAEKAGMSDAEYQGMKDAQAEKDTQRDVRKQTLLEEARAKYAQRAGGGGGGNAIDKLPPAVKVKFESLAKEADRIDAAILKSEAEGMWQPDKNPQQGALLVRQRVLRDQANDLLEPYIPKQGAKPGAKSPDDDIRALLMGDGASQKPSAAPAGAAASKQPAGPMANTDERTLQRLAAINGHANQKAAIEELKRRGKWQQPGQATNENAVDYGALGIN
jgi:hypothetical protein